MLDYHRVKPVFYLQVMPTAKQIMLLQICCVQLQCSSFVLLLCSDIRFASPQLAIADATVQPTYLVTSATC